MSNAHRTIRLRDYQQECLRVILDRYRNGVRRQLVCLPTGTGKTVIFAQLPSFLNIRKRMLVLAHRSELLDQARNKFLAADPGCSVEIEQGQRKAGDAGSVVIASVPTLGRAGARRLENLDPEQFYVIVVDEAHHATADTYERILTHFKLDNKDTPRLLIGFTATPKRSDGEGLNKVFDEIVFSRTLPEMINAGFLSPVSGYRVETDVDLSGVKTRMGDFVTSALSNAVNIEERNGIVVKVYKDHLKGRQTLVFCVDVAHAQSVAQAFRAHGIGAKEVTGDMPPEERAAVLKDFSSGVVPVLTNCMVLTEGYDEPSVAGIILARPTKSSLLYTQMIGRGTRLHPGKKEVTVIDIVDNTRKHALVTLPCLFGLSDSFDLKGKTTQEIDRAIRWIEQNRPWVRPDVARNLDDLRYRCIHVDLMQLRVPDELDKMAQFAWTPVGPKNFRLGLGKGQAISVSGTLLDTWEISLTGQQVPTGTTELRPQKTLAEAIRTAEQYVYGAYPDVLRLVDVNASWRDQRATDRQLEIIRKARLHVPGYITRGQASHLIAMLQK